MTMNGKTIEEQLFHQFGGREKSMPQTLMFDHVSPATRLLEKRRQMFEVQEALNGQKEEFSRREDAFRRREDALRRKDLELQESLIKFNKFLQENESKRNRALKRVADERKQKELKEMEIRKLEAQLKSKIEEERVLKEELEANIKYQDFLDNVVQNMTKFFPEIADILNRYKTLKDVNKYLLEKQLTEETLHENTQREFANFCKMKENQILNETNEISELQVKLEQTKNKFSMLQAEVDGVIEQSSDKVLQLGQILSSVSNIIERCEDNFRRRHNKPAVEKGPQKTSDSSIHVQCSSCMSKLDDIAMFMVDFKEIISEYHTEMGNLAKSNKTVVSLNSESKES